MKEPRLFPNTVAGVLEALENELWKGHLCRPSSRKIAQAE